MDKIQCKALLLMGYLVSFPRGQGTRAATLIKHRDKNTSPPCEFWCCTQSCLYRCTKCLPPSLQLPLCGKSVCTGGAGTSTNIRATLTWNQIHEVGTNLWILALVQPRQERSLQPLLSCLLGRVTWGQHLPPHLLPQLQRVSSKYSQSNPKGGGDC